MPSGVYFIECAQFCEDKKILLSIERSLGGAWLCLAISFRYLFVFLNTYFSLRDRKSRTALDAIFSCDQSHRTIIVLL